jgi:hypothetical protein
MNSSSCPMTIVSILSSTIDKGHANEYTIDVKHVPAAFLWILSCTRADTTLQLHMLPLASNVSIQMSHIFSKL